ncbi:MAG: TonB-dependent receptor, partial [Rhodobacteraceae bacterium]|nr:TonB-dependent receptor [Paracoccaceae bacterium]
VLDGQKKYYESYRQGSVFIDPALLKSIEVLRGPGASTLYSSGAMGGGIVMETKDASDFLNDGDDSAFYQRLSYGSNPKTALSTSILALRPTEGLEILTALTLRDLGATKDGDGAITFANDALIPTGLFKIRRDFAGPFSLEFSAQRLYTSEKDQPFDQIYNGALPFPFLPDQSADVETIDETYHLTLGYSPEENPLLDATMTLAKSKTEKRISNGPMNRLDRVNPRPFDSDRFYDTNMLRIENTFDVQGDGSVYLTAGLAYSETKRFSFSKVPSQSHPQANTDAIEAYALAEIAVNDRLDINVGGRLERKEISPVGIRTGDDADSEEMAAARTGVRLSGFEPQISALYRLNGNWNVFGSVARVERLPTADEIYDTFISSERGAPEFMGGVNRNLKAENGTNVELGTSFSGLDVIRPGDEMTLKGTVFQNRIKGRIERTMTPRRGPPLFGKYENLKNVTIRGLEVETAYQRSELFASAGLTWIEGKDDATGETMDSLQNNTIQVTAGYGFTREITGQVQGVFAQSRRKSNGADVPGYGVANLSVRYSSGSGDPGRTDVHFGIDNLFGKTYIPAARYNLEGGPLLPNRFADGRNIKLSIARTF